MNECLVTKLKASITDDSLKYLGGIVVDVNIPSNYEYGNSSFFRAEPSSTSGDVVELEIIGDGYFRKKDDPTSLGKKWNVKSPTEISLSTGVYKVLIKNKYAIDYFSFFENFGRISVDIEDFFWLINVSNLSFNNVRVEGSIEELLVELMKNSKTNKTIRLVAGQGMTLKGNPISPGAVYSVVFTTDSIEIYAEEVLKAEYKNNVWMYA